MIKLNYFTRMGSNRHNVVATWLMDVVRDDSFVYGIEEVDLHIGESNFKLIFFRSFLVSQSKDQGSFYTKLTFLRCFRLMFQSLFAS